MCMPATPSTAPPIYSVEPYMLFNGQYLPNRVRLLQSTICEASWTVKPITCRTAGTAWALMGFHVVLVPVTWKPEHPAKHVRPHPLFDGQIISERIHNH